MIVCPEIRERVLQLRAEKKTVRDIAAELTIGKSTVSDILKAAKTAPASEKPDAVPEPVEKPDAQVEEMPAIPQLIITEEAASGFLAELQAPAPPAETKEAAQQDAFISQFAAKMRKQEPEEQSDEQELIEQLVGKRATKAAPKPKAPKAPKAPKSDEEAPPPKRAPPEPPLDKGHMIAKITSLLTSFPGLFANHIKDSAKFIESLPGRSAADLKTQLELLESTRSIATGSLVLHALFGTIAGGVEIIGGKVGLQTQGYQRLRLSQDGALREIFRDIAFENSTKLKAIQRPELRLAMLMCQTLMAVDTMNRRAPAAPAPPVSEAPAQAAPATEAATVAPETADKFADL